MLGYKCELPFWRQSTNSQLDWDPETDLSIYIIMSMMFFANHFLAFLLVCLGSLSCWKTQINGISFSLIFIVSELFDTGKKAHHKICNQFGNLSFSGHCLKMMGSLNILEDTLMAYPFCFICVLLVISAMTLKQFAFLVLKKKILKLHLLTTNYFL